MDKKKIRLTIPKINNSTMFYLFYDCQVMDWKRYIYLKIKKKVVSMFLSSVHVHYWKVVIIIIIYTVCFCIVIYFCFYLYICLPALILHFKSNNEVTNKYIPALSSCTFKSSLFCNFVNVRVCENECGLGRGDAWISFELLWRGW